MDILEEETLKYWPEIVTGIEIDKPNEACFHAMTVIRFKSSEDGKWYRRFFRICKETDFSELNIMSHAMFVENNLRDIIEKLNVYAYRFSLLNDGKVINIDEENYKMVDELDSLQITEKERMSKIEL